MKRRAILLGCLSVALVACSLTQQAPLKSPSTHSGLVDYAILSPGAEGQAQLRYINPAARWTQYHKLIIEPVTYWADENSTNISAQDQRALCDFFSQALQQQFSQKFEIVSAPGPGVMRLQVALIDAEAATPVLRTVSMLVPQVRVLATLKYVAVGTYPFIGGAQVEAKLTDSQTGTILGEWADRRLGGGSPQAAVQWQWGDAENAITQWATASATRLASWTSGNATP
ncbi:MAG TPA: DUF3313 domain-containing protein [Candidatus Binatia bacterium]|nr:DUF3313 domain-containing protein [Candidatus Binatia bacterium]